MARFLVIIILIFSGLNGFPENVTIERGRIVATNWYRHYAPVEKTAGNISKVVEYKLKDATSFYIFSFDKGGFVMVSANDRVDPVLGYGFDGEVPELNVPGTMANPAIKSWFDNYAQQIDTIGKLNLKSAKIDSKWYQLTNNQFLKAGTPAIGPLLTTTWNQGCYYNAACPADGKGVCGRVWTGCVATSMAQLMKYWNFPSSGTGSHSYSHATYGTLSADFGSTTYAWSQMPNNVTSQNNAVATLMFHCGVSVDMDYSPDGSSASGPRDALVNYFKYSSKAVYVSKADFTTSDWVNLLKAELTLRRPFYYRGDNATSGHAFVCDGYQNTDYFHFNWGWGGSYDGYFYLANLNPAGYNFNSDQGAVIKIVPTSLPDGYSGFFLSDNLITLGANRNQGLVNIYSGANWTASSNQTWLTLNAGNGSSGTSKLILTASENNTAASRSAMVTVSVPGFENQIITVNQGAKSVVTAGGLKALLSGELAATTNLTLSGTIDARDFKTMRDEMPVLTIVDLSGVTIAAYNGLEGTSYWGNNNYPVNGIPECAFRNKNGQANATLTSITLPPSTISIGQQAFYNCVGLTTFTIPSLVTTIYWNAFNSCSGLSSITVNRSVPADLSSYQNIFTNVNKTSCILYVPFGTKALYAAANQWKDFTNILEMSGLKISATTANVAPAAGSTATVELTSNTAWTASSNQTWLAVSPTSETGNKTLTFTAEANSTASVRTATVTISASGFDPLTITISQERLVSTQLISFNAGWNIISPFIIPASPDLKTIFQPLIDAGKLKKIMDESGKTIENFGAFGGWKNNIGNLNSAKGYKVNMTAVSTLSLEGTRITLPLDLVLAAGWNIISYPANAEQDAKALVQTLIDGGQLKKVMDEAGKTIENFGAFGGWKNNIGNFLPGKGYKVNVASACTLTVTAPPTKSAVILPEVLASSHFKKVFTGNGTDHFNVHLVDLASSGLVAGDQIGIFDGNYCVGSATIGQDQLLSGNISIPASSNEEQAGPVNGFTVGHPVTLQLFRENRVYPLAPAKVSGSEAFEKNGSLFARISASDLSGKSDEDGHDQVKCYPNPFSDRLTIEIRLTEPKELEAGIYDLTGKLIRSLFSGKAGTSETVVWDGTNGQGTKMGSGTYILKVNEMVEKISLNK